MRVYVYCEYKKWLGYTGIGSAYRNHLKALSYEKIEIVDNQYDDYDILHVHTLGVESLQIVKYCKRNNICVVTHGHTVPAESRDYWFTNNIITEKVFKWWVRYFYNLGDIVIAPSENARKELVDLGVKKEIYVVSNGVDIQLPDDPSKVRVKFRERFGICENDIVVFTVGLVIPRKGLDTFVDIARQNPEIKFMWFGRIIDKGFVRSIRADKLRMKAPKNVIFMGYTENLSSAYLMGDIFIFPTYHEVQGIVLLEALMYKKPAVIRDIPTFNYLQHGKHCLKAKTAEEFTECIRVLSRNPSMVTQLVEEGYALVQSHTLEKIGPKYREIYEKLLSYRK